MKTTIVAVLALILTFVTGFSIARTMNAFASNNDACTVIASTLADRLEHGQVLDHQIAEAIIHDLIVNRRITGSIDRDGRNLDINGKAYIYFWNERLISVHTEPSWRFPFVCRSSHPIDHGVSVHHEGQP